MPILGQAPKDIRKKLLLFKVVAAVPLAYNVFPYYIVIRKDNQI